MNSHRHKKSFGQNFLKNSKYAKKLIEPLSIQESDTVLEIGPGDGMVTELLIQTQATVNSVEADYDLLPVLLKKFQIYQNFDLLHEDILKLDLDSIKVKDKLKVIGSLPYNISKRIIDKFLRWNFQKISNGGSSSLESMCFIVQEEVAKEYVAKAPYTNSLSSLAQLYSNIRKLESIPNTQFFPVPKVNGGILFFEPLKTFDPELKNIETIIKIGFSSPRKTLKNNLKSIPNYDKNKLEEAFVKLNLFENIRPAGVDLESWKNLAKLVL